MTSSTAYTTMAGLQAITAQMDATAANLANVQTPGYAAVQAAIQAAPYVGANAPAGADAVALIPAPNTQQGALVHTGDPFNVALGGNAWLEVQTASGNALTRNGTLQILSNGILADSSGDPILSVSGQPISLPALAKIEIGTDDIVSGVPTGRPGELAQSYGQINLVSTPAGPLTPLGGSLFSPASDAVLQTSQNGSLHQGYLNGSNVDPTQAMMALIAGSRSYQLQTELLKTQSGGSQQLNALLAQG